MAREYYFSIAATADCNFVGEVDGGARIDLTYGQPAAGGGISTDPSKLSTETKRAIKDYLRATMSLKQGASIPDSELIPSTYQGKMAAAMQLGYDEGKRPVLPEGWCGLQATLRSGRDWLLVGTDGVIDFDGRMTICDVDGIVIGAHILGRADLNAVVAPSPKKREPVVPPGGDPYETWKRGFPPHSYLPLALPMTFDVADYPSSDATAQGAIDAAAPFAARYVSLGRTFFVAVGAATFRGGPFSHLESVTLDVYRLGGGALQ